MEPTQPDLDLLDDSGWAVDDAPPAPRAIDAAYTAAYLDGDNKELSTRPRQFDPCAGNPIVLRLAETMDKVHENQLRLDIASFFPQNRSLILPRAVQKVVLTERATGKMTWYTILDLPGHAAQLVGQGEWEGQSFSVWRSLNNPWRWNVEIVRLMEFVSFAERQPEDKIEAAGDVPDFAYRVGDAAEALWGVPLGKRLFTSIHVGFGTVRREKDLVGKPMRIKPKPVGGRRR